MAPSIKALSSGLKLVRVSFSSRRSEMRRLSKASCKRRLPAWYMMLSATGLLLQKRPRAGEPGGDVAPRAAGNGPSGGNLPTAW